MKTKQYLLPALTAGMLVLGACNNDQSADKLGSGVILSNLDM